MANKPNNPSLWSKAKSLAKQKFDVYPSAYANGWAAKWYKSKGGTWSKAQYGMEVSPENMFSDTLMTLNREANIPVIDDAGAFNEDGVWVPDWETIIRQAKRYGSKLVRTKKGSLIKFDDQWNVISADDNPQMARGGEPQNPGFQALPDYVQAKILSNMAYGGYPVMQQGGEPDGAMALGQIDAAMDKLSKLRQFIRPDSDLEPWVSSKLTLMDDYASSVSDYMNYNPEAQEEMMEPMEEGEEMEEMKMGGIPQRYKNMGFNKVGVKKDSNRPGKKWMVLAKKGDQYKVVHGGYTGMKDYTQHGSEKRRENFWNRMGGRNSSKATDPFSPLYWHKRFGTWQEGGEIDMPEMKSGGSTWSGNAWYNMGGYVPEYGMGGMPCYECGGMYQDGGQSIEEELTRRERRELRHNHTAKQIKKAQMIAKQEFRKPWLRRQLERPDGWVENAILEKTPLPGMNSDDFYREYRDQRDSGSNVMSSLASAVIQHGAGSLPLLGKNVYKGLIKNPANLLNFNNPVGLALDYDRSSKAFVDGIVSPGMKANPGQMAAGVSNSFKQIFQPASNYLFRPFSDAVDPDDNRGFFPALAKSYIDQFRADPIRREVPWHLVRQARKDIREQRRKEYGGESEMMAPDPGGPRFGRGYGKRGFMGIKPVKQWTGRNDSRLENVLEFFDPTGISSWDDLAGDIRENKGKKRNWLRTASNVLSVIPRVRALYPGIMYADDLPKYVQIAAPARAAGDASKFWRHMEDMSNGAVDIMGGDYKNGGGIHINPANKGKFTASAKRAGMGVQEFAAHVLANKEDYSTTQVRRANFARNAANWKKQSGGPVEGDVLDVTPEQLEYLRRMGYQFEMI